MCIDMTDCKVKGCKNKYYARGYCNKHYKKFRYDNEPEFRERTRECSRKSWKQMDMEKRKKDRQWNAKRQKIYRNKHPEKVKKSMAKYYLKKLSKKERLKLLQEVEKN
jgi:hypothetical protein